MPWDRGTPLNRHIYENIGLVWVFQLSHNCLGSLIYTWQLHLVYSLILGAEEYNHSSKNVHSLSIKEKNNR